MWGIQLFTVKANNYQEISMFQNKLASIAVQGA